MDNCCCKMSKSIKKGLHVRLRKSCGQVLSALIFSQARHILCQYSNKFAALCLNSFTVFNILRHLLHRRKSLLQIQVTFKLPVKKTLTICTKWCVPVSSTGMHSVCVCEIHQNVKLLVCAIPGQCTYKELMGKVVCNSDNRNCMLHLCDDCPGKEALSE